MRILGMLCMRNEADRYLQSCLDWNRWWWDELFVYDDQSSDDSARIAADFGTVLVRQTNDPSFLDHEGKFRSAAWSHLEDVLSPVEGDWIFCFDADEFLISNFVNEGLRDLAQDAEDANRCAVAIHVPEMWRDDPPMIRVDGYWNTNWNPRFCQYRPDWVFRDQAMGCGSVPTYAAESDFRTVATVQLLHFGYVDPEARQRRYIRYMEHPEGHNPTHIQSIIETPVLTPWSGPNPTVWKGER